ncbi:MAG TPA: peptidoglycan DD-metalloendopeptidase family protein, partial [Acidiferrobacteraceae bacterium]|nr:peptidoglycan DD-metalloendopeptidase family protein [Acidiferrobacteraceae bacterium]
ISDAVGLQIQQAQQQVLALNRNQQRLDHVAAELKALSATQSAEEQTLLQDRRRQAIALAALNRKAATQQQQMRRLQQAARRLQRLVSRLRRRPAMSVPPSRTGPFGRHRLLAPVALSHWQRAARREGPGVFIPAPAGTRIRAVYTGRVVYAGWLRGFGLMLILEHEGGYMTIYAHAQSLFSHVGAVVAAGTVVAAVGDTGGFQHPGLYFEIRHNGRPLPALEWLRRSAS